jgi:outer membrane protein assembly factor BamB
MSLASRSAATALACLVPTLAAAESARPGVDWPSFRGSVASGVSDGFAAPEKWDAAKGEGVLWKTAIPGLAVSSPIVWGDKLFVTTAVSSDPNAVFRHGLFGDVEPSKDVTSHSWRVLCLDKKTGKVLWEQVAHEGVPKTKRHPKSSQASATPATDGKIVVAHFGSEGLYAYDLQGKLLWKRDLGVLNAGWFYDPDYEWGLGSSPIIWKNLVIVQCDIQKNSFLAAFDVATGQPAWRTPREEIPSWSTPAIFENNGRAELVTQATTFIRGYDPENGRELWRLSGNSEITIPTPIVGPGIIIVTNGYRGVQPIFAIKPGASGDITPKSDQTQNPSIAWSSTRGGPYIPTPVIYGDRLYVLQNNGVLAAYNVGTGERRCGESRKGADPNCGCDCLEAGDPVTPTPCV